MFYFVSFDGREKADTAAIAVSAAAATGAAADIVSWGFSDNCRQSLKRCPISDGFTAYLTLGFFRRLEGLADLFQNADLASSD